MATLDLKKLNETLCDFAYADGFKPTQLDVEMLSKLPAANQYNNLVYVKRWAKHMASFSDKEKKAFPAGKASEASKGGDDDDIDLFGSDDDEEAEKAKAERAKQLEAQKKGAKPGVVAKSSIVIDVKVWDDETDLGKVEEHVRSITKEGLLWGASRRLPLAYGIEKFQIGCVVEDEKVSVDWLTEQIEESELVQSTDIAAFQKI